MFFIIGLEYDVEWCRVYVLFFFMVYGYIWGGDSFSDCLLFFILVLLLKVFEYFEVLFVVIYVVVCFWNFKFFFMDEDIDNFENFVSLCIFIGGIDEFWFYFVFVVMEVCGVFIVFLMLRVIVVVWEDDVKVVISCLSMFVECLDDLIILLVCMYESCDFNIFYNCICFFLVGSKNMGEVGLFNGVIYEDGIGIEIYC